MIDIFTIFKCEIANAKFQALYRQSSTESASCQLKSVKYYLNKDASIQDLSNLLNISTQKLDQISIKNYACSCELLINEYRYKQFLEELESSINSNLSVESILKFSGFEDNIKFVDFIKSKQSIHH